VSGTCLVGVDIGGTFTDVIALDPDDGTVRTAKAPTTPDALTEGISRGVASLALDWEPLSRVVHGTTICTNALIERTHARTGFIGTRGFTDEFDIQRMARRWAATPQAAIYDFHQRKPDPFIARQLRREVGERVAYPGVVLEPLDDQELADRAQELVEQGAQALAVCFLWSSANPANEQRAKEVLEQRFPGMPISISSEVSPVVREYERMVTTAVNASLLPLLSGYLDTVAGELSELGFRGELMLMQSHGGIAHPHTLAPRPVLTLRSGPVGGAVAAARLARALERRAVLACDIGGTSTDTTVILDYEIPITDRTEVDYQPIVVPTADIRCIGAGGGSIAHLDAGGALRVGPASAGADPGPACYGRGGTLPTLTDANLVLGRLDEDTLRHEGLVLSRRAAHQSLQDLAEAIGRGPEATAEAIVTVAVANMAQSVRLQTVDRGRDPRLMTLMAFGGAGPLHATLLAEACSIGEVAIPLDPGVFSALGMVLADRTVSVQAGFLSLLDDVGPAELHERYAELERDARSLLSPSAENLAVRIVRSAAMRYELQEWELRVRLGELRSGEEAARAMADAFHLAHEARYGFSRPEKPVELVTLYVDAALTTDQVPYARRAAAGGDALLGRRRVYTGGGEAVQDVAVFERERLGEGATLRGPCIIEEPSATTYVHPGWTAVTDALGTLIATPEGGSPL
jgi:N-methylhydantoinase A